MNHLATTFSVSELLSLIEVNCFVITSWCWAASWMQKVLYSSQTQISTCRGSNQDDTVSLIQNNCVFFEVISVFWVYEVIVLSLFWVMGAFSGRGVHFCLGLGLLWNFSIPVPLKQYRYQLSTSFDTFFNFLQYKSCENKAIGCVTTSPHSKDFFFYTNAFQKCSNIYWTAIKTC